MLKHITIILALFLSLTTQAISDIITVTVPSAVADALNDYRADCTEHGGGLCQTKLLEIRRATL